MLPVEDPTGPAERGIRPIEASAEPAENLRRLRAAMSRGEGYVGFVVPRPALVSQSEPDRAAADEGDRRSRPALIEINPTPAVSAMYRLTVELGMGYARSSTVLDYKLAGRAASTAISSAWSTGPARRATEQPPRHDFGVLQPDDAAIDAIVAWFSGCTRTARRVAGADHRPFRMPRSLHGAHARPAGAAPAMKPGVAPNSTAAMSG